MIIGMIWGATIALNAVNIINARRAGREVGTMTILSLMCLGLGMLFYYM